ncbi:hypothetical protein DSO57_1002493 [Entomophthora muscae]|uniref:Uncharacterized protein n=1 Tax=Entomophthora muscae TaxID=34485 RepID=A0ACC2SLM1_9FUNG|nr:hypothetical protein DSO57_1002493 [Entomophthora muscae]
MDDTTKSDKESPKEITGIRFHLLMFGLFLVIFTAILDHSILSAALGHIVSDFNALSEIAWLPASYMLTTTSLIPLYGKLSDIFGRRNTLLVALVIFIVGSILCGMATSMAMLIGSRAFSGIGGGGLIALSIIIISDVVPLDQRGMYLSMTGIFFLLAATTGPLIGGVISDTISWRWNFFINVPIGIIAMVIVWLFVSIPYSSGSLLAKLKRIDFLGALTIVLSTVLLLLGLNWGGKDYAWGSWQIGVTLGMSLFMFALFVIVEMHVAAEPLLPRSIFTRNVISANITNMLNGFPFYVSINYIPIYYQVVHSRSATMSAFELLPMLCCITVISALAGYYTARTGRYRVFNVAGTFMILIGAVMAIFLRRDITRTEEVMFAILIGCGYGLCTQNCTILSQAAVAEEDVASVTALLNFTANLGGVLGLAILGAVYKNSLAAHLLANLPDANQSLIGSTIQVADILSGDEMIMYRLSYTQALSTTYLAMVPFCAISFIATLFLKHIPLKSSEKQDQSPQSKA